MSNRLLWIVLALVGFWTFASPDLRASISSALCDASIGCLTSDGTDYFVDENGDGIASPGEPNVTMNAPSNDVGDEIVQGKLTVVGPITANGITKMHETSLVFFGMNGDEPLPSECLRPFEKGPWGQAACTTHAIWQLPFKSKITRFCFASSVWPGVTIDGDTCPVHLRNVTTSTNVATITFANPGGDSTGLNSVCKPVDLTYNALTDFNVVGDATCCDGGCRSDNAFSPGAFQVFGYGVD